MSCWAWFPPGREIEAKIFTTLPHALRRPGGTSDHSRNQKRGRPLDCFLEGPVVVDRTLYLTDIPYGRIFAVNLDTRQWVLVKEYDGEPNGLAWDRRRKRLVIADFKQGILTLDPRSGSLATLVSRHNGERLKGPNDLIITPEGAIIFTDQGMSGLNDPSGRVYRLYENTSGNHTLQVLLDHCPSPNGLTLDKSASSLFVAMTRDNSVWLTPFFPDGTPSRSGRFSSYFGVGGPDGMALDEEGNVFVAHSTLGTIFVHTSDGLPLARIVTTSAGKGTTNLTWGGPDNKTLFIVESESGSIMTTEWHCRGKLYS